MQLLINFYSSNCSDSLLLEYGCFMKTIKLPNPDVEKLYAHVIHATLSNFLLTFIYFMFCYRICNEWLRLYNNYLNII